MWEVRAVTVTNAFFSKCDQPHIPFMKLMKFHWSPPPPNLNQYRKNKIKQQQKNPIWMKMSLWHSSRCAMNICQQDFVFVFAFVFFKVFHYIEFKKSTSKLSFVFNLLKYLVDLCNIQKRKIFFCPHWGKKSLIPDLKIISITHCKFQYVLLGIVSLGKSIIVN